VLRFRCRFGSRSEFLGELQCFVAGTSFDLRLAELQKLAVYLLGAQSGATLEEAYPSVGRASCSGLAVERLWLS